MKHFRLVFFIICFLGILIFTDCASKRKAYFSFRNPWNIGLNIRFKSGHVSPNSRDSIHVVLYNKSSQKIQLGMFSQNAYLRLSLFPRFFRDKKAYLLPISGLSDITVPANDSLLITSLPVSRFFSADGWKTKKDIAIKKAIPVAGKGFYPYMTVGAEIMVNGKIIYASPRQLPVGEPSYPTKKYKKADLTIIVAADEWKEHYSDLPIPIQCRVKNKTQYDMVFFENAGTVRFNLYGYGKNRTANLVLRFKDAYFTTHQKIILKPGEERNIFSEDLSKLFFKQASPDQPWYWEWDKKKEPVSPLYMADGKHVYETELWFGVVIDGKEYLSEIKQVRVNYNK